MMEYTPPVGFYFSVEIDGMTNKNDMLFQAVSGLSVDIETEEVAVGGENRYKLKLPVRTKFPNLVLKRGMLVDSPLISWCRDAIENFSFDPRIVKIKLLDKDGKIMLMWTLDGAYPVKWNVDEFSAMESKLVVETLELCYNFFKISKQE